MKNSMNASQRMGRIRTAFENGLEKTGIPATKVGTGVIVLSFTPTNHIKVAHGINWGNAPQKAVKLLWLFPYVQSSEGKPTLDKLHENLKAVPGALSFQTGQHGFGWFSQPERISPIESAGHDSPRDVYTQIATHTIPYEELTKEEKKLFDKLAKKTPWWDNPDYKRINDLLHNRFIKAKP